MYIIARVRDFAFIINNKARTSVSTPSNNQVAHSKKAKSLTFTMEKNIGDQLEL